MKKLMKAGLIILAGTITSYAMPIESRIITKPQAVGGVPAVCALTTYPDMAMDMGIEGNVVLQFRIDESGRVSNIQVIQSGGMLFDQAAIAAVLQVEWLPATHNSHPFTVLYQLPFKFCLD